MLTQSSRSTYTDILTVIIGSNEERCTVHRDLICGRSELIEVACSGSWNKSSEGIVRLSNHQGYLIRLYIEALYDRSTDISALATAAVAATRPSLLESAKTKTKIDATTHLLCELWVLSNFLGDSSSKNSVIDALIHSREYHKTVLRLPAVQYHRACACQISSGPVADQSLTHEAEGENGRHYGQIPSARVHDGVVQGDGRAD